MNYQFFEAPQQFSLGEEAQGNPSLHFEGLSDRRLDTGLERPPTFGDDLDPWDLLLDAEDVVNDFKDPRLERLRGSYPGVDDLTNTPISNSSKTYGDLADKGKIPKPKGVILHRTDTATGEQTLNTYAQRIKSGGHVGAQYLINEEGRVKLIAPVGKRVQHTLPKVKGGYDPDQDQIGIEVTGKSKRLDLSKNGKNNMKAQVEALDLSPKMKARLLSDPKLASTIESSGKFNDTKTGQSDPGGLIYEDIGAEQKRALWNLSKNLKETHGLDLTKDFKAHEGVQAKALGEGEASVEFLKTMAAYPEKVTALRAQIDAKRAAGPPAGMDAEIWMMSLEAEEKDVAHEEETLSALEADSLLEQQDDGPRSEEAQRQEDLREDFYKNFYTRQAAVDAHLPPPSLVKVPSVSPGSC